MVLLMVKTSTQLQFVPKKFANKTENPFAIKNNIFGLEVH